MNKLRVGIVGCGEAAQVIHIPALQQLFDRFEVTALCDADATVLAGVAERLRGPVLRTTDYRKMVRHGDIDVVLVANPNIFHAEVALAAMAAGKHVLIEKPICVTLAEADALQEAERRTGLIVQIGYMRRYAGALREAAELLSGQRDQIRLARVHDVIGRNALIIDDTSRVVRGGDGGVARGHALKAQERLRFIEAIGPHDDALAASYSLLLGLSSHDLSAMRELLGRPLRVLHATQRSEGRYVTATFDFGDFVCLFSTGVDEIARFDAHIEVYTADRVIRVDYDTPYVRHLPARLSVVQRHGPSGVTRATSFGSRQDTFVAEWLAFHESVATATRPRMSVEDARIDLELSLEIVTHLRAGSVTPPAA